MTGARARAPASTGRFSLRRRSMQVAVFVSALLVFVWAAYALALWQGRRDQLAEAEAETANLVRLQEQHAAALLDAAEMVLDAAAGWIARHPGRDARTDADFRALIGTMIERNPLLRLFAVIDESDMAHILGLPVSPLRVADREHVRIWDQRRDPKPYIGRPIIGRLDGRYSLPVSLRVERPGGRWVLAVGIELMGIGDLYQTIRFGESSALSLMRADGTLLMRAPFVEAEIGRSLARGRIFTEHLPRQPRGSFVDRVIVDNTNRVVSYARVGDRDLVVVASVIVDDVLTDWWRSARGTTVALGLLSLGILLMAALIVRLIRLDERRARAQQAALAAAEAANHAKAEFLACMSHELRTPLNAINGFSELMAAEAFGPLPARYKAYAADINHSGRHLLELVDDVLDTARMDLDKIEIAPVPLDAPALAMQVLRTAALDAERKQVTLAIEMPNDLPAVVADRQALTRILLNLVNNAIKFTPAGGRVTVSAAREVGGFHLAVRDTGIGIAAEDLPKLGQPFVQLGSIHSRKHGGSGLGLAICKALAEAHGGSLAIDSAPGRGTTVTVRLPQPALAAPPDATPSAAAS